MGHKNRLGSQGPVKRWLVFMVLQGRFIAFIFLFAIMLLLGCDVIYKGEHKGEDLLVRKLNTVLLTTDDLPTTTMGLGMSGSVHHRRSEPPFAEGFSQSGNGPQPEERITIRYWLFHSIADAQQAADKWRFHISALGVTVNEKVESIYQSEPNAEDVIADATWRPANRASIWFVKNNVLVYIMARNPRVNQLPLTRKVARKIEAKIQTVLKKK